MRDNLKADKTELNKKADLTADNEQTFKGIINVPNFDSGYSNMTNVMNKRYIDQKLDMKTTVTQRLESRLQVPDYDSSSHNGSDVPNLKYLSDTYLNKKTGGSIDNSIAFNSLNPDNKRQIHNLGSPQFNSSAVNKSYVDTELQKISGSDLTGVLKADGSVSMTSDLNMGNNKVTHLKDPTNDTDAVNKKYVDLNVNNNIQSSNDNDVFKYVMNDPDSQLSEEDDIELGGITTYNSSPHQVNKNVVNMKLLLDSSKGYYSSRLGINLYPLENGDYTICFELFWIDPFVNTIFMNGVSSIETIHNVNKKIFLSQKYARLVCQFTKSQNIGNNYLYIDLEIKLNSGKSYQPKFQTFFVVYGIDSHQSDVHPSLYDALIYTQNGYVFFNAEINMFGKQIIGIGDTTDNSGAVNFKQMKSHNDFLRITLQDEMKLLQKKSYYEQLFEYYFDLLDPNSFDMENSYGSNIESVGGKLILKNAISLSDYDLKQGFSINLSHIQLDNILDQNDNFTLFVSFLHDDSLTGQDYYIGLGNNINPSFIVHFKPHIVMKNDKFLIRSPTYGLDYEESILSVYRNKHLFLWFCKQGNTSKAIICQGGHINETIVPSNYQANRIVIHLPYKIQRIGFSENFYNLYDEEFHKISFLEKSRGVFFE